MIKFIQFIKQTSANSNSQSANLLNTLLHILDDSKQ